MGRSVSYPSNATVAYAPTPCDSDWCVTCESEGADCTCEEGDSHILEGETDWDRLKDDLVMRAKALFPSLYEADGWRGREDHTLARNGLIDFGVSEYCGLMAVWMVPRADFERAGLEEMAERWIESVTAKFQAEFGEYYRVGGFSNGTSLYQKTAT
jgi:hypothetical protein